MALSSLNWKKPLRRVKTGEAVYVVGHGDDGTTMHGARKVASEDRYGAGGLWYRHDGTPMNHPGGRLENYNPREEVMQDVKDVPLPSRLQKEKDRKVAEREAKKKLKQARADRKARIEAEKVERQLREMEHVPSFGEWS